MIANARISAVGHAIFDSIMEKLHAFMLYIRWTERTSARTSKFENLKLKIRDIYFRTLTFSNESNEICKYHTRFKDMCLVYFKNNDKLSFLTVQYSV